MIVLQFHYAHTRRGPVCAQYLWGEKFWDFQSAFCDISETRDIATIKDE